METDTLLKVKIEDTGLPALFCAKAKIMGFGTLEDILAETPEALCSRKGFDYAWLAELAGFLAEHQLLHLLQPTPGKTRL